MTAVETTKRVLAERALREREAEIARVQEIGLVGGFDVHLRERFRSRRSREYLLIHGLPPEAANETHEDWLLRVHPDDRAAAERQFRDAVRGDDREYRVEYRIIRPSDGQVRWIGVRAEIERADDGEALRLVGANIDITDRKRAELALQRLNETLEQQVAAAHARARPALARLRRPDRGGEFRRALGQHQSGRDRDPRLERGGTARDADRLAVASGRCDRRRSRIASGWSRAGRPSASRTAIATRTAPTAGSSWSSTAEDGFIYARRPRRDRRARSGRRAAAHRGAAAPGAEDGSGRPAHRRHRARFQQSADRHHRLARPDAEAHRAGPLSATIERYVDAGEDLGEPRRRR